MCTDYESVPLTADARDGKLGCEVRLDDSEAVGGGHAFQGGRVDSGESTAAVYPSLKDSLNSQSELAYTFPLGSSNRPLVDPEKLGERLL
jgi:hypothetical protein